MGDRVKDALSPGTADSVSRRAFCKKVIKRCSIALAIAATGRIAYEKPSVRSFFSASDAYAASTGPGKFSLKGDSH